MKNYSNNLEALWDQLLSRDPEKVKAAFSTLAAREQDAVLSHLHSMLVDAGWHAEQRLSAKIALQSLNEKDI